MPSLLMTGEAGSSWTLDDVITTKELETRPRRLTNHREENEALVALAQSIADNRELVLQQLVDSTQRLCGAESAGISILETENGEKVFRWQATSGKLQTFHGNTMPRDFSPCGAVLDCDKTLLMQDPQRFYPYISGLKLPIHEVLLVPFRVRGKTVGTLWAVQHGSAKQFDLEDERLLTNISKFAAAAVEKRNLAEKVAGSANKLAELGSFIEVALEAGAIATWSWDPKLDRVFADRNTARFFSVTEEDANGGPLENFLNAIHPGDLPHVQKAINAAIRNGTLYEVEYRISGPNKSVRWVQARGKVLRTENDQVRSLAGILIDITERKRADRELRKSEAFLRGIMGAVVDCVKVLSSEGRIEWMSDNGKMMMEVTDFEALRGLEWVTMWTDPLTRAEASRAMETARTGQTGRFRGFCKTCAGTAKWWDVIVTPLTDGSGQVRNLLSVSRDVTTLQAAQEGLRDSQALLAQHNKELEEVIADRTKALKDKVVELEAFSYGISHDLRAPLRAMQSFAALLGEECGSAITGAGKEYIRKIVTAGERMDHLIRDVLVLTRVSKNEMPMERIELGSFIASIIETYPQFDGTEADISVKVPLAPVRGNAALLTQSIANLIENGIKFTSPGVRPRIQIHTDVLGDRVKLFVRDNGIGIATETQRKIFDIFYKEDPKSSGTGIGLTVVRKSVERMGGAISVESDINRGSVFCLNLELAKA